MPRISDTTTYPKETTATIDDYLIGTDAVTLNTKTFTIGELKEAIDGSAGTVPTTLSVGLSPSDEYLYTVNNTTADKPGTILVSSVDTTNASLFASPRTSLDQTIIASTGGIQFFTNSDLDNQAPTGHAVSVNEYGTVIINQTGNSIYTGGDPASFSGTPDLIIGDNSSTTHVRNVRIGEFNSSSDGYGIELYSQRLSGANTDHIRMGQLNGGSPPHYGILKYGSAIGPTYMQNNDFALISFGSSPKDIRIGGSSYNTTLTVKGTSARVGINQTAPATTLDVGGTITAHTGSAGTIIAGKYGTNAPTYSGGSLQSVGNDMGTSNVVGAQLYTGTGWPKGLLGSISGWNSFVSGSLGWQGVIGFASTGPIFYATNHTTPTSFQSGNWPIQIKNQTGSGDVYNDVYLQGNIHIGGSNASYSHGNIIMQEDGNAIDFSITAGPTGSGATSTNSKLIDYQEGTWAAQLNGTNVATATQTGYWTKIGRKVTLTAYIDAQHATPSSTATLDYITGVPFTPNSQQAFYAGNLGYIDNIFNGDGNDVIQCYLQQSNSRIYINHKTIASSPGAETATGFDFENNSTGDGKVTLSFELTYFI